MREGSSQPEERLDGAPRVDEHLFSLAELTSVGLYLHADDRLLYINTALASLLGYSASEALEIPVSRLLHPQSAPVVQERTKSLLSGMKIAPKVELCLSTRNGRERWFEVTDRLVVTAGRLAVLGTAVDITERRRVERFLAESERKYRTLLDQAFDGIFLSDPRGNLATVNDTVCNMSGFLRDELLRMNLSELLVDGEGAYEEWWSSLRRDGHALGILHMRRRDGSSLLVEVGAKLVDGSGFEGLMRDVSERQRSDEHRRLAATVFETSVEGILITDPQERILAVNRAFTEITGYEAAEVVGKTPRLLQSGRHDALFYKALWRKVHESGRWEGEIWNRRRSGEIYAEWLSLAVVRDPRGKLLNYVATFEDRVRHQAHYDLLTELPNRLLLWDRLSQALARARRQSDRVAVLFVDLDRFKQVNDRYGHATGDQLLQEVARRLRMCVRESDTVARLSGDEFVVLLPGLREVGQASIVAQKIVEALSAPYGLGTAVLSISPSIGIALAPEDGKDAESLIAKADAAMYRVKQQGRGSWSLCDAGQQNPLARTGGLGGGAAASCLAFELQRTAAGALRAIELIVEQPPIDAERPPSPAEAVLQAEHSLRQAAGILERWNELPTDTVVAIEVPAGALNAEYISLLRELAADRRHIELQLQVTDILGSSEQQTAHLLELAQSRVSIVGDGFGEGGIDMMRLSRFPLAAVRLPAALTRLAGTGEEAALRATIAAGHALGWTVIASGVETLPQRERLSALQCDALQGKAVSDRLTLPALEALLALERSP